MSEQRGLCNRCGAQDSQYYYEAMMHPGTFWCDRCLVEEQVNTAREAAANLAKLEARLIELGGPVEQELCGYILFFRQGDPLLNDDSNQWGKFCWLPRGHEGYHDTKEGTK